MLWSVSWKKLSCFVKYLTKVSFQAKLNFLPKESIMKTSNAIDTFLDYQKVNSKKIPFEIIFISWHVSKKTMGILKYQKLNPKMLWFFWPRLPMVKSNQRKNSNFLCSGHSSILSKIHLIHLLQIHVIPQFWRKHSKRQRESQWYRSHSLDW